MTDHQEPGLGGLPGSGSAFMAERARLDNGIETPDSEPVPRRASLEEWAMAEAETVAVRHSMPAEFPVMDLAPETSASPDQLARRARLQRIVMALVVALGVFDAAMLWVYYR